MKIAKIIQYKKYFINNILDIMPEFKQSCSKKEAAILSIIYVKVPINQNISVHYLGIIENLWKS